jgi:GR25 family glycosyltransferase involved in LPS biosynthesis
MYFIKAFSYSTTRIQFTSITDAPGMNKNVFFDIPPNKMRAFIITMPERQERVQHIIRQLASFGISAEPIEAVDARNPKQLEALFDNLHPTVSFALGVPRVNHATIATPGGIGCYASHIKGWQQVARMTSPAFIIEDDLILNDFASASIFQNCHDMCSRGLFDMIQLGHSTSNNDLAKFDNSIVRVISPINGTMMCCLSPRGAQTLLRRAGSPTVHVDMVLGMLANVSAFQDENAFRLGALFPSVSNFDTADTLIKHDKSTTKYLNSLDYIRLFRDYYSNPERYAPEGNQLGPDLDPSHLVHVRDSNGITLHSRELALGPISRPFRWYNSL